MMMKMMTRRASTIGVSLAESVPSRSSSLRAGMATLSPGAPYRSAEPVVVPQFELGPGPSALDPIVLDCDGHDMKVIDDGVVRFAKDMYEKHGAVLFRNTGLRELSDMRPWILNVMGSQMEYEGGANYRKEISPNVYDVGAPKEAWLHYHHEMAYVEQSTISLGFCCSARVSDNHQRGMTYLSDNIKVTDDILSTDFGQKLKEKGICYIRCLTDGDEVGDAAFQSVYGKGSGVYNTWQSSFLTDDPKEAEARATEKGLEYSWGPGRYMRTKYYTDGFEYCPQVDRNVLFSSIADNGSWFDTWPGIAELPNLPSFDQATPSMRPLKITFGDDSPMSDEDLKLFADVYDRHGFPVNWEVGDILVFCNYRWAHGRPAYTLEPNEERTIGVVLGPMFDRQKTRPEKW